MTLFKKVFDNHYSEGTPQFDSQHDEELDFDDVDDEMLFEEGNDAFETDEFGAGTTDDANEADATAGAEPKAVNAGAPTLAETPARAAEPPRMAPELPSSPASVPPVAPQSRAIKPQMEEPEVSKTAPVTQPVLNTEANLSLAERAAKAHALIQSQSKKGDASQKPTGTPLKLERRITPMPERSDVVPLYSGSKAEAAQLADTEPKEAASPKGGRVRTRLLGFHGGGPDEADPMQAPAAERAAFASIYPTGWLVVIDGPGEGHSFAIQNGVSTIGRGDDQTVVLDFGDNSISRQSHAAIAYDCEQNKFFVGHGGKSNIIRLNNKPVLSTEELNHEDTIRIGETTLRFVALCGEGFKWERS